MESYTETGRTHMSLISRIGRFASSPQGRRMADKAKRYAQSPEGRARIDKARKQLMARKSRPKAR